MRLALADSGQIMFSDFASAQPRMETSLGLAEIDEILKAVMQRPWTV